MKMVLLFMLFAVVPWEESPQASVQTTAVRTATSYCSSSFSKLGATKK